MGFSPTPCINLSIWQDGLSKERFLIWIMMHLFLLFPQPVGKWAGQEKRLSWACLCGMSMGKRGTQSLGVSVTELRYGGWLPNHWRELMLENYSSHCPCGAAKISRDILPPHLQIVLCDSWGPKEPVPGTPTVTNSQPLVSAQSTSVLSLLHSPSWFFCDSLLYTTDPKPVCTVPLLLSKVSWNIIEVDELYGHPTSCKLILDIRHVLSISHIFFLHLNFVTHWANIIYTHSRT